MVASFLEYMQKEGETDERYRKKAISVGTKMHLWCAAPNQAARELRSKGKAPVWLYMPACFEETRFVIEFGHCARRGIAVQAAVGDCPHDRRAAGRIRTGSRTPGTACGGQCGPIGAALHI